MSQSPETAKPTADSDTGTGSVHRAERVRTVPGMRRPARRRSSATASTARRGGRTGPTPPRAISPPPAGGRGGPTARRRRRAAAPARAAAVGFFALLPIAVGARDRRRPQRRRRRQLGPDRGPPQTGGDLDDGEPSERRAATGATGKGGTSRRQRQGQRNRQDRRQGRRQHHITERSTKITNYKPPPAEGQGRHEDQVEEIATEGGADYIKTQKNLPDVITVGGDPDSAPPLPSGAEP